jgi:predicted PurR-regulated permease PerM
MLEKFWDARTFRVLFTALLFVIVLFFLREASSTLALFLFAILFAYFLEPLVGRLQKPLRGRATSIAVVYVLLLIAITLLIVFLGPKAADELRSLASSLPALANKVASGQIIDQFGHKHGITAARQAQLQQFFLSHKDEILGFIGGLVSKLGQPASHLWWLILIPILSLFFLKDGPEIAVGIVDLGADSQEQNTLAGIVDDINVMLGSYIRAQLTLAALTAVVLTIVLSLMRVPYAFVLGPVAGLFEFIPVVGPAIACVLIWGLAAILGYPHLLWVFLFLGTWRIIQDYVSAPRIMGNTLEIPPLASIFGVLAGGEIGGVIGALVAVPVIAILRILYRRLTPKNDPASEPMRASQLAQ